MLVHFDARGRSNRPFVDLLLCLYIGITFVPFTPFVDLLLTIFTELDDTNRPMPVGFWDTTATFFELTDS